MCRVREITTGTVHPSKYAHILCICCGLIRGFCSAIGGWPLSVEENEHQFLKDRPWISNQLDITFHVIASQLSDRCDVISNRLWRHQQNVNWASETRRRFVKIVVFIVIYGFVMSCKNIMMYALSWRTVVCALTRVLIWCLFPSLMCNMGNKHQNNPLVSAYIVRHSITYILLYHIFSGNAS